MAEDRAVFYFIYFGCLPVVFYFWIRFTSHSLINLAYVEELEASDARLLYLDDTQHGTIKHIFIWMTRNARDGTKLKPDMSPVEHVSTAIYLGLFDAVYPAYNVSTDGKVLLVVDWWWNGVMASFIIYCLMHMAFMFISIVIFWWRFINQLCDLEFQSYNRETTPPRQRSENYTECCAD